MINQNKNPFKDLKLDKEEQSILNEAEKGKFIEVKDFKKTKEQYKKYAQFTLNKLKNINIRLTLKDLQKLKVKAAENGLPYQTLAASILHHYTNDKVCVQL